MKIICLTSNEYLNILPGFAYLFNKYYPGQEVTIVRYEDRPPKLPDNFKNYAIGQQSNYSWSGGLKRYLNDISDEFVLLMLEDYYLDKPVDVELIEPTVNLMNGFKEIMKFDLTDDRLKVKHTDYGNGVIQSDINAPFLASLQAAIWRRDFLLAILNTKDNPWKFEKNKRTKLYLQNNKGVILGCVNPPMSYVNAVGGEGHKPGEYDLKKLPESMIEELKANHVWFPKGLNNG
jgi:hypothetical protein